MAKQPGLPPHFREAGFSFFVLTIACLTAGIGHIVGWW